MYVCVGNNKLFVTGSQTLPHMWRTYTAAVVVVVVVPHVLTYYLLFYPYTTGRYETKTQSTLMMLLFSRTYPPRLLVVAVVVADETPIQTVQKLTDVLFSIFLHFYKKNGPGQLARPIKSYEDGPRPVPAHHIFNTGPAHGILEFIGPARLGP